MIAALLLAMVVTRNFKGRGLTRTIFFLPSVIPMVAATMVWIWMFDPTYGYINHFLSLFGMEGPSWLMDPRFTKWALLLMGTWSTGTTMLVCMNALQDVPQSYYESAEIDGANAIQRFFHITVPGIAHVLVYQAVLNMINAFQYFQQVYVIISASSGGGSNAGVASGGPANSILMYPLYLLSLIHIFKAVRELGSERRETVRSLSVVGVGSLRRSVLSTRGPGWTYQWCTSCHASGTAGQLCAERINAEGI